LRAFSISFLSFFATLIVSKNDLELKIGIPRHNNIKIIHPPKSIIKFQFSTTPNMSFLQTNGNIWIQYTFDEINTGVYAELKKKVLEGV